jgi:hypothetical protein
VVPVDGPGEPFGLRPILSHAETVGQYLVGAFQEQSTLFVRGELETRVSSQHSDYFGRGILAIRTKLPATLAVARPAAFVEVSGA